MLPVHLTVPADPEVLAVVELHQQFGKAESPADDLELAGEFDADTAEPEHCCCLDTAVAGHLAQQLGTPLLLGQQIAGTEPC